MLILMRFLIVCLFLATTISGLATSRRAFLTTTSTGIASLVISQKQPALADEKNTKILVLGGTGLVGSRIVATLKSRGVEVIATSRDGRDGTVALDFETAPNVASAVQDLSRGCTAVISTVGVIGSGRDDAVNGASGLAAAGAKEAGVNTFVFISVAPEVRAFAKNIDFLQDYMEGKKFSEDSIVNYFPNSYTLVEPTFIYGGDKFGVMPPRVTTQYGSFIEKTLATAIVRTAAGLAPDGFVKIALEPPVSAEAVANAAVAGALGKLSSVNVLNTYDLIKEAGEKLS
jgi:uncharacterized protein YbjT (DUF2867 family)